MTTTDQRWAWVLPKVLCDELTVHEAEPVKPGETLAVEDQARGTSVSGGLIQTSAGTGLGSGSPLTKRSGWVA